MAWASLPQISFLATPAQIKQWVADAGLEPAGWVDVTEVARTSFAQRLAAFVQGGAPPLSLKLIIGDAFPAVMGNMLRNVEENRVVAAMGVWRKP